MKKLIKQLRYIRDNWDSPTRRPVWQMAVLLPLWLIYVPANKYVNWMDGL